MQSSYDDCINVALSVPKHTKKIPMEDKMKLIKMAFGFLIISLLFAGCAQQTTTSAFSPQDLRAKMQQEYIQKVDNFLIVFDASSSMFDSYNDWDKLDLAKDTIIKMNRTIPDLKMTGGLRVFGPSDGKANAATKLVYGMVPYAAQDLDNTVRAITSSGLTPMSTPLAASAEELKKTQGDIALIVISDGLDNGKGLPVAEADKLKKELGDRLCIYTILVGDSPEGKQLLEKVAQAGQCGFVTSADDLTTSSAMADYVEKVFLKKGAAKKPEAAAAESRMKEVASINLNVLFDFDKDNVKKIYHDQIKKAADFMIKFPDTVTVIEGHTDNRGTEKYNGNLSRRRAESVRQYLIKNFGIASARLTARGYGFSKPIASNKTDAGRQENRRVVAVISAPVKK